MPENRSGARLHPSLREALEFWWKPGWISHLLGLSLRCAHVIGPTDLEASMAGLVHPVFSLRTSGD